MNLQQRKILWRNLFSSFIVGVLYNLILFRLYFFGIERSICDVYSTWSLSHARLSFSVRSEISIP